MDDFRACTDNSKAVDCDCDESIKSWPLKSTGRMAKLYVTWSSSTMYLHVWVPEYSRGFRIVEFVSIPRLGLIRCLRQLSVNNVLQDWLWALNQLLAGAKLNHVMYFFPHGTRTPLIHRHD